MLFANFWVKVKIQTNKLRYLISCNNLGNKGHYAVLQYFYGCKIFSYKSWRSYFSILIFFPKANSVNSEICSFGIFQTSSFRPSENIPLRDQESK